MTAASSVLARFKRQRPWRMDETHMDALRSDARLAAPTTVYVGPSGCGKTRASFQNALTCAYVYGLTLFVLDINAEWPKQRAQFVRYYVDRGAPARGVVYFLEDDSRIVVGSSPAIFERCLERIRSRHPGGVTTPQAVWVCDEGLLLRERGDEGITALALQARNHGVAFHLSGQRMKLGHPSTLETIRAVVPWGGGNHPVERLMGLDVSREQLNPPKASQLRFLVGATGAWAEYDTDHERHVVLCGPCFPSNPQPSGFLGKIVDR